MAKYRYSVDFPKHMAECELNYSRLLKLLPNLDERQQWRYLLGSHEALELSVIERARYTTFLQVVQCQHSQQEWQVPLDLQVRLYHDARSAEVVAWNRHRQIQARYTYPNKQLYQENEKTLQSQFLGEWLSRYLEEGRVDTAVITASLDSALKNS